MSNVANLITAGDRIEILPASDTLAEPGEYEVVVLHGRSAIYRLRRVDDGRIAVVDLATIERFGQEVRIVSESPMPAMPAPGAGQRWPERLGVHPASGYDPNVCRLRPVGTGFDEPSFAFVVAPLEDGDIRAKATELARRWNRCAELEGDASLAATIDNQARTIAALQSALATAVDQRDRALSKLDEWIERADARADARRERIVKLLDDVLRSSEEAK